MKAVVVEQYGGPEVMTYKEVPRPDVQDDDVLIRVKAASVNFADINARKGTHHTLKKPPYIPGIDVSGVVEQVGKGVHHLSEGQRVIAFPYSGSYAEWTVAKETLTLPIPESMGFDEAAACALVCFTSYNLLKTAARLAKGETVLIHAAAGGVGTTAIQLAKILGASKVIGTVGSDEKARVVQSLGADYVVNYRKERFVEKVLEWTEGEGVDVILDSVAGEVGEESMKCLARYGRLVNYGNLGGRESTYYTNQLQASCRSVIGFSFGTTRKYRPEIIREQAHEIFKYVTERQLKVIISKKYDLHQAEDAHRFIESRKSIGKVILIP